MGGASERSEESDKLYDMSQELAHELTEIAIALPPGWQVQLDPNGQMRVLPPATRGSLRD